MNEDADDHNQVAAGLAQVAAFLRMAGWREAEPLGLTPTQGACLQLLTRRGPNRVTVLAKLLGVTQATASDVVAALERKGLVARQPDPDDRRASHLHATAQGAAIAWQLVKPPAELAAATAGLTAEENAGLRRGLAKIILGLQKAGAIEPQRLCVTCAFFRPYAHSDAAQPHHCAFVDAPFGDADLRFDCRDHDTDRAGGEHQRSWHRASA